MGKKRKHSETNAVEQTEKDDTSVQERLKRKLLGWKDKSEVKQTETPGVFRNKEKVLVTCSRRINYRFNSMGTSNKKSTRFENNEVDDDEMSNLDEETSEFESELESDSEGDEDVKLVEPSKTVVYNKEGLNEKLEDISWPENIDWIHRLSIELDQEQEVDVNDDLQREAAFYTQALDKTRQAFEKLQSMGLPFLRPADYYAEMVKSDPCMEKVKRRLLSEQKEIEEAEKRKKAREAKKLAKEIQAQKTKERAKQKKEGLGCFRFKSL